MGSLWKSKTYLKNPSSPLSQMYVFKEVLWIPVGQRAAKLWSIKLGGWSHHSELEPWLQACGGWAPEWQNFFSNLQLWKLVTLQQIDLQWHKVTYLRIKSACVLLKFRIFRQCTMVISTQSLSKNILILDKKFFIMTKVCQHCTLWHSNQEWRSICVNTVPLSKDLTYLVF